MYKCIKNFKIIISCILILSLAVGFITLRNFVSAGTQNNDYASVNRDTFISVDTNGVLQINRSKRDKEEIMGQENAWTLFIYLCGSNLETQYQCASKDIREMLSANFNSENINKNENMDNQNIDQVIINQDESDDLLVIPNRLDSLPNTIDFIEPVKIALFGVFLLGALSPKKKKWEIN